jgi:hypothetical protein
VALAAVRLEYLESQTQAVVEEVERFLEPQHPLGVLVVPGL